LDGDICLTVTIENHVLVNIVPEAISKGGGFGKKENAEIAVYQVINIKVSMAKNAQGSTKKTVPKTFGTV